MKSVGHRWGPLLDMETDDPEIGGEDSEDAREKHQGGPQDILHSEQEIQTGDNTNREGNRFKTDSTDSKAKEDENERKDRKETRYLSDSEYNEKKQKLFRYAKQTMKKVFYVNLMLCKGIRRMNCSEKPTTEGTLPFTMQQRQET